MQLSMGCTSIITHRPLCLRKTTIALLAAALLASGCSINPYVREAGMEHSLPTPAPMDKPRFAGDLEQAIQDVDNQRVAYYSHLSRRTVERNLLSGGLIALSAGALYLGVTGKVGEGQRAITNLGALAGGAYALGNYSNSPDTELAYLNATNDLTCLILRTRPWLVKEKEYTEFDGYIQVLLKKINKLDAMFQNQIAQSTSSDDFVKHHDFERQMLYNARVTLRKASNFKGFVDSAGFQLRQEAVLASNVANFEILRIQPALANPSTVMVGLRSTNKVFNDIKPVDVPHPDAQNPKPDAQPEANPEESAKPSAGAAPSASVPPSKSAAAAPAAPEKPSPAISDLGKQADMLAAKVVALQALLDDQQKTNKTQAAKTQVEIKKLKAELHDLNTIVTTLKPEQVAAQMLIHEKEKTADAIALAKALSDVMEAMRPVNATLTRAYSLRPYVKGIPECQPRNAQLFEFAFDASEVTLNPGQSFDVAVKGGVGVPHIWLSGAISDGKEEAPKFTTSIDGGIARAKLTILSTTPPGEMHIMAVDGSNKQRDDIKVIVVPAPAKK